MESPLVTIALITYNQERYVRKAVRGVLSQTYRNLRIVISDDASSDGTVAAIRDEVALYKNNGGEHLDIVINVNSQNLGITGNWNEVVRLARGDLLVAAAGDDICVPERVSTIVKAWLSSGSRATIIHHGYYAMEVDGSCIVPQEARSVWAPYGASAAYVTRVFSEFPPLPPDVTVEDIPWALRAYMLGEELRIPDCLVYCRQGSGVSTRFKNMRQGRIVLGQFDYTAYSLLEKDLDAKGSAIEPGKLREIRGFVHGRKERAWYDLQLVSGRTFHDRLSALRWLSGTAKEFKRKRDFLRRGALYLLPTVMHDGVNDIVDAIAAFRRGLIRGLKALKTIITCSCCRRSATR